MAGLKLVQLQKHNSQWTIREQKKKRNLLVEIDKMLTLSALSK